MCNERETKTEGKRRISFSGIVFYLLIMSCAAQQSLNSFGEIIAQDVPSDGYITQNCVVLNDAGALAQTRCVDCTAKLSVFDDEKRYVDWAQMKNQGNGVYTWSIPMREFFKPGIYTALYTCTDSQNRVGNISGLVTILPESGGTGLPSESYTGTSSVLDGILQPLQDLKDLIFSKDNIDTSSKILSGAYLIDMLKSMLPIGDGGDWVKVFSNALLLFPLGLGKLFGLLTDPSGTVYSGTVWLWDNVYSFMQDFLLYVLFLEFLMCALAFWNTMNNLELVSFANAWYGMHKVVFQAVTAVFTLAYYAVISLVYLIVRTISAIVEMIPFIQ